VLLRGDEERASERVSAHLAAEHVARLEHDRLVPGFDEVPDAVIITSSLSRPRGQQVRREA